MGKRANKKRNRSNNSSDGSTTNVNKRSKSVREMLHGENKLDQSLDLSNSYTTQMENNSANSTPISNQTSQGKINFDELSSSPVVIPELSDDTPAWAKALISSVETLKHELNCVSEIAKNTQLALEGLTKGNLDLSTKLAGVSTKVSSLESVNLTLKAENTELKERLLQLEFHQKRYNLVFSGIPESDASESGYDCYVKILQCLSNIPELNVDMIKIDRCHRLGSKNKYRPRDIIARMNWYGDLMQILNNRSQLPEGVYVNEDLPAEWEERRKLLRPLLLHAKSMDKYRHTSFLSRDKLIIDGKAYTVEPVNNLRDLPSDLVPAESCERRNESTIAFLGPHSVFSNFHLAPFTEGGVKYCCTEQMIQAEKSAMFNDHRSLELIMRATNPYRIKELGSRVHGFDRAVWQHEAKKVVTRAVTAKFTQNKNLAGLLRSTGTLLIVEASPDKFWGTGVHLRNREALDRSKWNGNGVMSEILH